MSTRAQNGAPVVVIDASALLAWLFKERNWETVDTLIAGTLVVAPASVMVETLYRATERGHRYSPTELQESLLGLGITIEPVTADDTVRAAELIRMSRTSGTPGSISLGDALCIAVAERLDATLTGGDEEWESLDLRTAYLPFR